MQTETEKIKAVLEKRNAEVRIRHVGKTAGDDGR